MNQTILPLEIKRISNAEIQIAWSDGVTSTITSEILRKNCPCASCRERRGDTSHAKPLSGKRTGLTVIEYSKDIEIDLKEIFGVGQYAIGFRWGDGHDTGIYTFQLLRELT